MFQKIKQNILHHYLTKEVNQHRIKLIRLIAIDETMATNRPLFDVNNNFELIKILIQMLLMLIISD
ncbi:hypothetical protein DERP_007337 [Dermatophagoides pteronyssinus]|uniref:Uncharacterized protein n=1 Tax=Dermatophagoides pteronyssinus TaxID=6956 RepID=A0ABQ8J4B4_DERPT|nr:hypothetical protein DERP_007337 [Dermatophagoides pteronyssinus]